MEKIKTNIDKEIEKLKTKPALYWERLGEKMVMDLFSKTAKQVPAYRNFLKKHKINYQKLKTIGDLNKLPAVNKQNYIRINKLEDFFPNKDISYLTTFSATSGSTGEPAYFPRGEDGDKQYEYISEIFLRNQFDIHKKKTLGIIGFGLGIWIGGVFTYKNFNKISAKGYPLTLIPVGPNKDLFLKSLVKFGHLYDQIILMGYAPFIKDVIDDASDYGVDWKKYNIKIFTAAEGYSEEFKKYITDKAGIKNPLLDFINLYGTVELGTMAHETALTNLIRKIANENPKVKKEFFSHRPALPTLAQYYPHLTYFEEVNREVVGSGAVSMPLLRYSFPDIGGVIKFEDMIHRLKLTGIDIIKEAKKYNIDKKILKLPFVYVYERADSVVSLYGIQIYSDIIRSVLINRKLYKLLTGKFTMIIEHDNKQNQYLKINLELKNSNINSAKIYKSIECQLLKDLRYKSSELNELFNHIKGRKLLKLKFWPNNYKKYFSPGMKQKWAIK